MAVALEVLDDLVEFYKALSDRTRLRIVGLLGERPRFVGELADALGVSAPTVSHHLSRLRSAGLIAAARREQQVFYTLRTDRFARLARTLLPVTSDRPRDAREQVLRAFFEEGRLRRIPATRKKRLVVLQEVARRFEPGRFYPERAVDAALKEIYHDHCELRRGLVDHGFFRRERGVYERIG